MQAPVPAVFAMPGPPRLRSRTDAAEQPWPERLSFYGFCTTLVFCPLAWGAVQPWSIFVLQAAAVFLFLAWMGERLTRDQLQVQPNVLYLPLVFFGLLILLQLTIPLSAYRHATLLEVLKYFSYGLMFFLAAQFFSSERFCRRFAMLLLVFGSALSVYAMIQGFAGNGKVYWLASVPVGAVIYGPYVNHNHYAGLMEMLFPIALVIAFRPLSPTPTRMLAGFGGVVMISSIFLSLSRGGMLACVVELVALAALVTGSRQKKTSAWLLVAVIVVTTGFLLWLGSSGLLERIASLRTPSEGAVGRMRLVVLHDGLKMFRQHPLLGWGLGTFPFTYPMFRSFSTDLLVNQAHNDWLQLLLETGLLGFCLTLWFVIALYRTAMKKLQRASPPYASMLTTAALVGCTGLLVHSLTDFNLHIPANAAIFFVLCAAATAPLPHRYFATSR
jgi:O-antigen ligase